MMNHVCRRPGRLLAVCLHLAMLLWLLGCKEQGDTSRPAIPADIYGTWNASGLNFESAGQGSTPMTTGQAALFNAFKAGTYTFNWDSTYVKRSSDSTLSATTVLVTLERGTFKLLNGQLVLTTQDALTKTTRNQYLTCNYEIRSLGTFAVTTIALQVTKDQLLQTLEEEKQTNPSYQQTRDFLLERNFFRINQTLRQY
ncbi:hypothetical protein [Spirosoma validum]|uniref:Lipocalin-like domain-containing protein n=1 Tax=Spirosoma validum TaxID=2771355 RepID=A0A927B5Z7_9BACT|nr:hypothetical protein [Spirosoma validum]MBD2755913.1 hypothetical protein [Spirosoma validum]